jgi:hypothetical protein
VVATGLPLAVRLAPVESGFTSLAFQARLVGRCDFIRPSLMWWFLCSAVASDPIGRNFLGPSSSAVVRRCNLSNLVHVSNPFNILEAIVVPGRGCKSGKLNEVLRALYRISRTSAALEARTSPSPMLTAIIPALGKFYLHVLC